MSASKHDSVSCCSDTEYADRPQYFTWNSQRLEIIAILTRWRAPGEKGFRVQTTNQLIFEIVYREIPDEWEILQI